MRMLKYSCITIRVIVSNIRNNKSLSCIHCSHKHNTEVIFIIVVETVGIWWGPDGNVFAINGPHTVWKIPVQSKASLDPVPVMLCWYWEVFFP